MLSRERATFKILALIAGMLFYFTACNFPTESTQSGENYNLFQGLEKVEGAEQTKVTINQGSAVGRDAYFEFEVDNVNSNLIKPGKYDGWCIEWTKPIAQQGDTHENLQVYSTYGIDKYKPLNYFLNIKEQLKSDDPELTFKEFQAVIWSIAEGPEFNVDNLSDEELPPRLLKNGVPDFSKAKVKAIVDQVHSNAPAFKYSSDTKVALFIKTGDDEQDIMVPSDPDDSLNIEIVDLGSLPDRALNEARAINNYGAIAGLSHTHLPHTGWAFFWEEGTGMVALDTHPDASREADAFAYAINNQEQVAGYQHPYAIKWNSTTGFETLGEGVAYGINDLGVVVGERRRVYEDYVGSDAIVWDENGDEAVLESLSEYYSTPVDDNQNVARDINNNGQIVGYSSDPSASSSESRRAVIWEDSAITHELGTLGGNSEALAINDNGQVVGRSEVLVDGEYQYRAFIWDEVNGIINLGTVDGHESEATGINNQGQVVGNIIIPATGTSASTSRGFYWDEENGMTLLEPFDANYSFSYAYGINDEGVVVGTSSTDEVLATKAVKWIISFEN